MDSCKLGTCDALKQAEARVRELEVENAAAKQEVTDMDSACNTLLSSVCAERDSLEAFKARVMAWARGNCGTCGTDQESESCLKCRNGYDLEEFPQAAQYADNWTLPQALEVGE